MNKPVKAIESILQGKGTEFEFAELNEYLRQLENFYAARSGEQSNIRFRNPKSNRDIILTEYAFAVPDSVEGSTREFNLVVYRDRTCFWQDTTGRLSLSPDKLLESKAIISRAAQDRLAQEIKAFTYQSKIGEEAYWLLAEKQALQSQQYEFTTAMEKTLDNALAPYFWKDINRRLQSPLTRITARPKARLQAKV